MVSKRRIEETVVGVSVMRMADKIRERLVPDDEDLPSDMPDFLKDMVKQAAPVALAIIRITELSKWN